MCILFLHIIATASAPNHDGYALQALVSTKPAYVETAVFAAQPADGTSFGHLSLYIRVEKIKNVQVDRNSRGVLKVHFTEYAESKINVLDYVTVDSSVPPQWTRLQADFCIVQDGRLTFEYSISSNQASALAQVYSVYLDEIRTTRIENGKKLKRVALKTFFRVGL